MLFSKRNRTETLIIDEVFGCMTVENASIFFHVSLIHDVMSIVFQFEFEINDRQTGAEKIFYFKCSNYWP